MIPVVMEARMQNTSNWSGTVGGALGEKNVNMTEYMRPDIFEAKCEELASEIHQLLKGSKTLPNNKGKYEGLLLNGMANGIGVCTWDSSVRYCYEDEWKDDKMHGRVTLSDSNGNVYEGECKGDNKQGRGMYKFGEESSDGDIYEGDWKDGKRNGRGTLRFLNGDVYEGEWKDNMREGEGLYRFASGAVYEDEFKDDTQHGQRRMRNMLMGIYMTVNG